MLGPNRALVPVFGNQQKGIYLIQRPKPAGLSHLGPCQIASQLTALFVKEDIALQELPLAIKDFAGQKSLPTVFHAQFFKVVHGAGLLFRALIVHAQDFYHVV